MTKWWCSVFLACPFAFGGGPLNNPVTVVLDFDLPHSELSLAAMQEEVASLLKTTGITLDWRLKNNLPESAEFKDVVVIKMKGQCGVDDRIPALFDERGPLGMTFVSDGQVLSFGELECTRIKQSVERGIPHTTKLTEEKILGRAMGRVLAHEMFHMLTGEVRHAKSGVTQASLTADELTSNRLDLQKTDAVEIREKESIR